MVDTVHDGDVDVNELLAANEELRTQLEQYKMLAQGSERRILDLHTDCMKKDEEIAQLKEQLSAKTTSLSQSSASHAANAGELAGEEEELFRKLFVGGLSYTTTSESLRVYFSRFGEVSDCIVMKDAATGKSRGFGFVIFTNSDGVDAAQAARPHEVDGRAVETRRAIPRGETAKHMPPSVAAPSATRRVFIGGLRTSTEEATVHEYFSQYGAVEHVDLPEDKTTKRRRGFGYVSFTDTDPVDKVTIIKFHTIDGRKCEVKKAVSKSEMDKMQSFGKSSTDSGHATMHPGFSNNGSGNMGMGGGGAAGENRGFMPGANPGGAMVGGGMFPPNMDQQMLAMGYAAYMASLCGNMGVMGNMGMPNMGGGGGMNMMAGGGGFGGMANNMGGGGVGGSTSNLPPSEYGAGGWEAGNADRAGGKIRGGSSFSHRSSGPYGSSGKQQPPALSGPRNLPSYAAYDQLNGEY